MKATIAILFSIVVALSYFIYYQNAQINPKIIDNSERIDEHTALLKQLMGVGYEQKEKYLFKY